MKKNIKTDVLMVNGLIIMIMDRQNFIDNMLMDRDMESLLNMILMDRLNIKNSINKISQLMNNIFDFIYNLSL